MSTLKEEEDRIVTLIAELAKKGKNVGLPVAALLFMAIGIHFIFSSHAASPVVSQQPENGSITSPAVVGSDSTASGGKYVRFAANTSSPSPNPGPTPSPNPTPNPGPNPGPVGGVSATNPCVGAAAPAQWKHVVVLMFENKTYNSVIGNSGAPYINGLSTKCGTYASWKDANYKISGAVDGNYVSKPNYATYTSGVSPSVHGMKDDSYATTSNIDNIFNRLNALGKNAKDYESGGGGSCASSNFSGAYHDPMRYYNDLGGHSSASTTYCNQHDVPIANFMTDVNSGNLPAYSFILPTNSQNMHDNSIASGDAWAKAFLDPFLNSTQYKSGDTALFFLWDEDTPIPNVLIAPSIKPSSKPVPSGSLSFSHFSALRTWQEMLGISPLLGDTGQAPSLLNYYNGH